MSDDYLSPEEERRILRALERSSLHDYPNPDRLGCPGTEFLKRLAFNRKSIPLSDPALDHVSHCSPCFSEYVRYRHQARCRSLIWRSTAAAVFLLAVVGIWYTSRRSTNEHERQVASKPPVVGQRQPAAPSREAEPVRTATIKLQNRSIARGISPEGQPQPPAPINIPNQRLDLLIELPLGSDPGRYEVQLLSEVDQPLLVAEGHAMEKDGTTVLHVSTDLRPFVPGRYRLGLRRPPSEWTYYPVQIR